ncbi:MAG TPA: NAD(P)/FAD-dependent oxidoreductase [Gammaproteobacteria bacterium]|nr:NAD(P)/FAD-dependent oxidoreductase [Gammaproteobacteria bacterium]
MSADIKKTPETDPNSVTTRKPKVAIIGAGMSGLLSAIKLRERGVEDIVIFEKADRIGGTWRDNTYPGLSCDVPAHMYTYTFEPNPEWSNRYAYGPEIFQYFEHVAEKYDLKTLIRFNSEVESARYENGKWSLKAAGGGLHVADIVIGATGVLHHPNYPDIEGIDSFAGDKFHTARWDHEVNLTGKKVGIVGTGSTATQIVPEIIDRVGKLDLFQRTPQWVFPLPNKAYTAKHKARLRADATLARKIRDRYSRLFEMTFAKAVIGNKFLLWCIGWMCKYHLESKVKDPVLREKMRPSYQAACKRLIFATGFYEAIQKPNAEVVTDAIARIEPDGIRTADGRLHELDVLVLATGFHAHNFMRPMELIGKDGVTIDEVWAEGAYAFKSVAVPGFPNFFLMTGPNSPIGNYSLITINELQLSYVLQLVDEWMAGNADEIEPKKDVTAAYNEALQNSMTTTVWVTGCKSWYFNDFGKLAMWPWSFDRFREAMSAPSLEEYELRKLDSIPKVGAA